MFTLFTRCGRVAGRVVIGGTLLYSGVYHGTAIYAPKSGDFRDKLIVERVAQPLLDDGVRPDRYEYGIVEGSTSLAASFEAIVRYPDKR